MDHSTQSSTVHGISPARILEWAANSFSKGSSQPRGRTKVSCIFCTGRQILYHCESESHSVVSDSLRPRELYTPWNSPGQNTGVDSLSLLQGIFPTQGPNPGLLHCRRILYQLSYQGSPGEALLLKKPVFWYGKIEVYFPCNNLKSKWIIQSLL